MKVEQLKIVFQMGEKSTEVIWKIIGQRENYVLLQTEFGPFWANYDSYLFEKGELVISVEIEPCEKYAELIRWIDYQFSNTNNLHVLIEQVISNSAPVSSDSKVVECKYNFINKEWSEELNLWVYIEVKEKISYLPKSEIKLLPNGKSVVPLWLITRKLPVSFCKTVDCVRLIQKSDVINIMHSTRKNILSTSS